jgi:hypothetical protein
MRQAGLSEAEAIKSDLSLGWRFHPGNEATYRAALETGRIVDLRAGTKIKQIEGLYGINGRLIKSGPATEYEMIKEGGVEVLWVTVKEGLLTGKRVCLPSSDIWPRFGPWP